MKIANGMEFVNDENVILIMKSAIGAENIRSILNNINRRFIQPYLLNVN